MLETSLENVCVLDRCSCDRELDPDFWTDPVGVNESSRVSETVGVSDSVTVSVDVCVVVSLLFVMIVVRVSVKLNVPVAVLLGARPGLLRTVDGSSRHINTNTTAVMRHRLMLTAGFID